MGNGMNKIIPGLYVGNFRDSRDEEQLKENKITHILSIHDNAKPHRSDMIYLCLSARDAGTQDISQYFSQCNDFIHSARIYGGTVLVHCLAGMSRSVTVTVAYIMTITDLGWRDALNVVRVNRQCASPNFGFQKQLLAFQHDNMPQERSRLEAQYSSTPATHTQDDSTLCQKLLDEFVSQQILENYEASKYEKNAHRLSSSSALSMSPPSCQVNHAVMLMDEMYLSPRSIRNEYYDSLTRQRDVTNKDKETCQTFASLTLDRAEGAVSDSPGGSSEQSDSPGGSSEQTMEEVHSQDGCADQMITS